jgi:glycosyltransferase involved in cell wall biosynthesis
VLRLARGRDEALKILRVIARLNIGGPARHVVLVNAGLDRRGHETLLVHGSVERGEGTLEHLATESALRTVQIPDLGRRISLFSDVRAFVRLFSLIRREAPDVVHTHTAKAGTLGRLAAAMCNATRPRSRRSAIVHTFHGHVLSGYFGRAGNAVVRIIERGLARLTDRIITISPAQRNDIVGRFRVASERQTSVIPLGLALDPLFRLPSDAPHARAELGIGEHDFVVGFVGRFVPIKDVATLIRAFARALLERPGMHLLLAGDGPLRHDLERLAQASGAAGRVRFLGWTEDLRTFYATVDVVALTSLNEGTPVALIEAMAASRAVVATDVGGVPDVVENGRTGLLVSPGDPEAFAEALVRLAADEEGRRAMGASARLAIADRFSTERLVNALERLYAGEVAGKRRMAPERVPSS